MKKSAMLLPNHYSSIPDKIRQDRNIDPLEKCILMSIINQLREGEDIAWPPGHSWGFKRIAKDIGESTQRVFERLEFLEIIGRIWKHTKDKNVGYEILRIDDNISLEDLKTILLKFSSIKNAKVKSRLRKWSKRVRQMPKIVETQASHGIPTSNPTEYPGASHGIPSSNPMEYPAVIPEPRSCGNPRPRATGHGPEDQGVGMEKAEADHGYLENLLKEFRDKKPLARQGAGGV